MGRGKPLLIDAIEEMRAYAFLLLEERAFMGRVHYADHVHGAWVRAIKEIEHFLKTGKPNQVEKSLEVVAGPRRLRTVSSRVRPANEPREVAPAVHSAESAKRPDEHQVRFRGATLADAAANLLLEHRKLHGKKIEELVKMGGYRSSSKFFQNVMESSFKRDGRFRNLGGNVWELKEPTLFGSNGKAAGSGEVATEKSSRDAE
jgi:hypothetical protein